MASPVTPPEPATPIGRGTLALLVLVVLAVVGAGVADAVLERPETPAAEPVELAAPTSGAWFCPVTAGEDETAVVSIAAVGEETATVSIVRHRDEGPQPLDPVEVAPNAPHDVVLDGGEARFPTTVRWSGGPVVAVWRVEGRDTAGARCETAPTPVTHITGFETTAQSTSTLHLYNPFGVDAVARVTFGTPTGPVSLVLTDNVLVPAGQTTRLELNEFEPEQPELAVTVEVLTGRIVSQGVVALAPTANQPGPTGRAVLAGAESPDLEWAFAHARSGDDASSWLTVYNPNPREAAVEVRVSNPLPDGPALLGETSVPAGGVTRVDLTESSASVDFGIAVVGVNEEPVVVSRLTNLSVGGAEGISASPGEQADVAWALVGGGAADRGSRVSLYNPGTESVTLSVEAGDQTPAEWSGLVLEPNEHAVLELSDVDPERRSIPALVRADGPIVADLRIQSPGENLRLWTVGGVPSRVWEGPGVRPAVRRDARLSTRPAAVESPDPEG
jgi:hypothetical protein